MLSESRWRPSRPSYTTSSTISWAGSLGVLTLTCTGLLNCRRGQAQQVQVGQSVASHFIYWQARDTYPAPLGQERELSRRLLCSAAEVLHRHRECLQVTVSYAEPDLPNQGNLRDRFWAQPSMCLSRQPLEHMLPSVVFQELLHFLLMLWFLRQQLTAIPHTWAELARCCLRLCSKQKQTKNSFMLNALHGLLLPRWRGISCS